MTPQAHLRRLSMRQEKRIATEMRGRTTPASGALRDPTAKSDVVAKCFRVEAKLTQAASYVLKLAVLRKIEQEALYTCKIPLLSLEISGERFAVMRWDDFMYMSRDAKYL